MGGHVFLFMPALGHFKRECCGLPVLSEHLEERLRMGAGGAGAGGVGAFVDVAAVAAAPPDGGRLLEDGAGVDIGGEAEVAAFVLPLGDGDGLENPGDVLESEGLGPLATAYDIDPASVKLVVVGRVLEHFDETMRSHVRDSLTRRGVIVDEEFIQRVEPEAHAVEVKGPKLYEESALIWCGGVRGNSIIERNGFSVDKHGRGRPSAPLPPPERKPEPERKQEVGVGK